MSILPLIDKQCHLYSSSFDLQFIFTGNKQTIEESKTFEKCKEETQINKEML